MTMQINILARNRHFYNYIKSKIDFDAIDVDHKRNNLGLIEKLGRFAWRNHPGCFFDAEIENLLITYGDKLENLVDVDKITHNINRIFSAKKKYSTLHIATEIADIGGHTRVISQLIKRSNEIDQFFVLTDQDTSIIPSWFEKGVKAFADISSLKNFKTYFEKAFALRLLSNHFKRILIYTHPYDVTPTLAFAKKSNIPVAVENHAHSWFWYGKAIADLIFCHTEYHTEFTKKYRKADNCLHLPFTQVDGLTQLSEIEEKETAKKRLNINTDKPIILSVATREKFIPNDEYNFFKLLNYIVKKYPDVVCIVVGLSDTDVLLKDMIKSERILFYPSILDLTNFYLASDICLESMPQPSLGVQIQAPLIGLSCPLPKYGKSRVFKNYYPEEVRLYNHHFGNEMSKNEFLNKLDLLMNNKQLRLDIATEIREYLLKTKSDDILYKKLMDLYDNIDSLRHTPKLLDKTIFFEDDENIEIAERSEFQDLSNVIDYWKDELPRHNLLPLSADYEISTSDYAEKELTKTACKREKQIDTYQESPGEKTVKFISFYLPQYHPIPENDQWWGKGFTEWTNVAKARPLFQGHYQPHLPADLGFYDLRLPEAREAQAELAKKYGISGFCYYHYWFNGKRLLDYPLQQVLKSGKPDFPFCLCWANENWTRAWHGRQGEILIGQDYSVKDDRNHIKWLLNIFKDKRYIRINNKPLMLIYLTTDLPNAARTTDIWRNEAYKMGEELYLCKVESAPWEYGNPALNGFDASVEFQPDWGKMGSPNGQLDGGHRVFEYEKIVEKMISKPIPPYKRFPCVTPMWDNSPRKKQSAVIFANSTPDLYEKWLSSVISKIDKFNLDENIIFINAWNEWAEGNHLEPDAKNGKSYLYATKKSLSIATSQSNQFSTKFVSIVISTLNQLDYTKACLKSIQKFTEESHEIIFVDNGSTDGTRDFLKNLADSTEHIQLILNETNSGFAAGKNLAIKKAKGDYILILNSDVVVTENWLDRMIQHIEQYPEIGMVGPMSNSASSYQRLKIVPYGDDMNAMHMFAKDYTAANFGKRNNILKLDSFCLLIKKDVFDIIGSLDENYGNGDFEDDDLCLQAAIAGYNSIIAHDVFVHHYNSISLKDNSIDLVTTAEANHQRFREKWQGVVEFNGDEHSVQITKELQLNKLLELGENKFIEGNLRNAVKIFERTLQLDPSNSETLNNLGVIQWQLGAAPSAIKTFQQALSSDPQNSDALYNLVQVAKETGRTDLTSIYLKENDNKVLSDYEDTSGLEKEVYCIWIVNVPGNIHHTFDEIALGLKAAFRKLGFDAPVVTDPDNISGTAIVLGCNRLAKLQISELPENIILYNLEQVQPNSPWLNDNYLELLRSHPVWDYSNINMKELEKIGVTDVTHCGIGYEPELTKIPQIEEDIDVLFYGSINDRRKQILEALKESGLNIVTLFGAYGGKRDEYIARAKIILNIHYYEAKLFEIVRISYLLANKKFIISEPGSDIEFEKIFDGGIVFSKIEDIANDCHKYLKNENFRKAVATKGFEIFKNHSQSDFLKKVIKTH